MYDYCIIFNRTPQEAGRGGPTIFLMKRSVPIQKGDALCVIAPEGYPDWMAGHDTWKVNQIVHVSSMTDAILYVSPAKFHANYFHAAC